MEKLDEIMFDYGLPTEIWADNGAPYSSKEWTKWTNRWNIKAKFTTAYHPQANGMVERYNKLLKKVIHAAITKGKNPKKAVKEFTYAYRNTPHSTTGEKPSKLFFNRDIKEKIPTPTKTSKGKHHDNAKRKIKEAKEKAKAYTDKRRHARDETLEKDDLVMIRQKASTTKMPWDQNPTK